LEKAKDDEERLTLEIIFMMSNVTPVGQGKNKRRRGTPIDRTEAAFNVFDSDKDGYVTKQEFLRNTTKLTDEQVTAMIDRLDVDGDGKLNKEEFEKLMAKAKK